MSALPSFESVGKTIAGIAHVIHDALAGVEVEKASIEFGLEVGAESTGVASIFASVNGTADLHVTLELSRGQCSH